MNRENKGKIAFWRSPDKLSIRRPPENGITSWVASPDSQMEQARFRAESQ